MSRFTASFGGKIGAVDKYLSEKGRLTLLQSVDDVHTKINPIRRDKNNTASFKELPALKQIVDAIDELAAELN